VGLSHSPPVETKSANGGGVCEVFPSKLEEEPEEIEVVKGGGKPLELAFEPGIIVEYGCAGEWF